MAGQSTYKDKNADGGKKNKLKKIYIFSERFVKLDSSSAIFKRKQRSLCFSTAVITVRLYPKWKYVERVKAHFIKICHVE